MAEEEKRPSPDALLEVANRESRGRLKVFLGAANLFLCAPNLVGGFPEVLVLRLGFQLLQLELRNLQREFPLGQRHRFFDAVGIDLHLRRPRWKGRNRWDGRPGNGAELPVGA